MNTNDMAPTRHEISIAGDTIVVMDEDGNTYDAQPLMSYRAAKQQVQCWARIYTINVADAYRTLHASFAAT